MATIRAEDIDEVLPEPVEFEAQEQRDTESPDDEHAPEKSRGFLLDEDERTVAEWIEREVQRRQRAMDRRMVWSKANRAWRAGMRFVRVKERQDEAQVYVAPSTGKEPPTPNKCDQLVRRMVATLMVDPPAPDCVPASGEEEDRDTAEFSTRALEHEMEEMGYLARHEDAMDKSFTYSSAFEYFCVDPYGDRQPVEVLAHPEAESVEPDPRVNPLTGQVEPPFVKRFVREDGTLTDNKSEARLQWVPRIRMEVLTAPHVHFLPEYCEGIDDADGVICCYPTTLGELRAKFEREDEPWSNEVLRDLASYKPPKHEDLLPRFMDRGNVTDSSRWRGGVPPDDQVCFPFLTYMAASASYPMGAYVLSVGKSRILHRDEWKVEVVDADGNTRDEDLPIPLAQVRNLDDHQDGDPYGTTVTRKLGQMDEMRALQIGAWLEFLDRFNHPREYLPIGSIIQPDDLNSRDGRPIYFNPEGQPHFEQIPAFPAESVNMLSFISNEMDVEASMAGASGQTSSNITSGYQQRQVIEQALVGLSGIKRNADAAFVRGMRIILSLMRFFTVPQRLGYVSEAGRYKEHEWTAADLGDTRNVRIRRGTSTMMATSAKQALAREELELGLKVQDPQAYPNYRRSIAANADALTLTQDDPIRMRVRGQVHEWEQGPSEELRNAPMPEPPPPVVDPVTGAAQPPVDPQTGQPLPPAVHPMTEAARKLFASLPIDMEPLNARVRHEELSAAMAGARFAKHPGEWQQGLIEAYESARQAAGIQTLAEQQQAQQQAQQAQQQAEAEKERQKSALKLEAKVQENAMEAEMERNQREQDAALDMERSQIEAAARAA